MKERKKACVSFPPRCNQIQSGIYPITEPVQCNNFYRTIIKVILNQLLKSVQLNRYDLVSCSFEEEKSELESLSILLVAQSHLSHTISKCRAFPTPYMLLHESWYTNHFFKTYRVQFAAAYDMTSFMWLEQTPPTCLASSENAQACDIAFPPVSNHTRQGFTRNTAGVIKQTQ